MADDARLIAAHKQRGCTDCRGRAACSPANDMSSSSMDQSLVVVLSNAHSSLASLSALLVTGSGTEVVQVAGLTIVPGGMATGLGLGRAQERLLRLEKGRGMARASLSVESAGQGASETGRQVSGRKGGRQPATMLAKQHWCSLARKDRTLELVQEYDQEMERQFRGQGMALLRAGMSWRNCIGKCISI